MKDSNIKISEAIAIVLTLILFTITGLSILKESYDRAMIAWVGTSIMVFVDFCMVLGKNRGKVLDLRRSAQKGPKASYQNPYGQEGTAGYDDYGDMDSYAGFSGEGVGNMRVYQRGEQIDYKDSD